MKKENKEKFESLMRENNILKNKVSELTTENYHLDNLVLTSAALVSILGEVCVDLKKENDQKTKEIKNVVFEDNKTIVYFADGSSSIAKCSETDTFSKEVGLATALAKDVYGKKYYVYRDRFCIEDEKPVV